MSFRFRTYLSPETYGVHSNGTESQRRYQRSIISECIDEVEKGNGHYFRVNRYEAVGGYPVINGSYLRFGSLVGFENVPVSPDSHADPSAVLPDLPIGGEPSLSQAATSWAAQTNPSRPLVDIPVFAIELRELPDLLFKKTDDIGRDIARGRLTYEYGYRPLISDLLKLLDFQNQFEQRVKELDKLNKSGLRRKRTVFKGSAVRPSIITNAYFNRDGCVYDSTESQTTVVEWKCFGRWAPDIEPARLLGLAYDRSDTRAKAIAGLTGISNGVIDASTIWELLPYSWLADWCTNAGDYLAAHRNIVGAHISGPIQVMRHLTTTLVTNLRPQEEAVNCKLSKDSFIRIHESKSRDSQLSLELDAHLPFLSGRQIAILGDVVKGNFGPGKVKVR